MKIEALTNNERETITILLGTDLIVGIELGNRAVFSILVYPCIGFTHRLSTYIHWVGKKKNHWEVFLAHRQNRISEKWCVSGLPEFIFYVQPETNCELLIFIEY